MVGIGKLFVIFGAVLVVVGLVLMFFNKIPFLGKLPGDIHIKKDSLEFYFPIVTCLILSIGLSLLFWLFSHFRK
jgi:hypothetical protein